MPGLVPGIHALLHPQTWMAGASPAMTGLIGELELHAWRLLELGTAFAEIEKLALREAKNSCE
jgi:hypothetical protein